MHRVVVDGVSLNIADGIDSLAALFVAAEMQQNSYRLNEVPFEPGDVVIDIGGHVGIFSCVVAKLHPEVTVYTFEPVEENYQNFVFNLEANGITNVKVVRSAITADGRPLPITMSGINTGGASAQQRDMHNATHVTRTVPSRTLDSVFDELNIQSCKLLKIDCEGSEHEVLLGSSRLGRVKYLRGEFHINTLLESQGHSIDSLIAHCRKFIAPDHIWIESARMAE